MSEETIRREATPTEANAFDLQLFASETVATEGKTLAPSIFSATESTIPAYGKALQGKGVNAFLSTNKKDITEDFTGNRGEIQTESGVSVIFDNLKELKLTGHAHKLLRAITMEFTSNVPFRGTTEANIGNFRIVHLSVERYMELCGITDRKEARKAIKEACNALYSASLKWEEERYIKEPGKRTKKQKITYNMRILSAKAELERGDIIASLTPEIALYLSHSYITFYPTKLFLLNTRSNPNSLHFGDKLTLHYSMNMDKPNANIIGVLTLLKSSPNIPRYEEIASKGQIDQRIIEPFERDLDELKAKGVINCWHYCNTNGAELTEDQLKRMDYETFSGLNIYFELADFPDQTERLAKKKETIEKRKKAKAKQERSKKKAE